MEFQQVALVALGLFIAGLVKGVTGIGYATCAMPLLALAVGLHGAMALVIVPALISNVTIIYSAGALGATFKRFRVFYAGILPGIVVGTQLLPSIDVAAATRGLAVLTLAYVVLAVAKPQLSMPAAAERVLALPAGILNGVLTGLTGSQIVPLVPYMLALKLDAAAQVQAINLAVTIASVALGLALFAAGIVTLDVFVWSCAGALPATAGTLLGNFARGYVAVDGLKRLTLAMLVLMAGGLVAQDISDAAQVAVCRLDPSQSAALSKPLAPAVAPAWSPDLVTLLVPQSASPATAPRPWSVCLAALQDLALQNIAVLDFLAPPKAAEPPRAGAAVHDFNSAPSFP